MSAIELKPWLEKLEDMIDMNHVKQTDDLQKKAFAFEKVDHVPTVINYPLKSDEWPQFSFQEIFNEPEKMLLSELAGTYAGAKLKDDRCYALRANYGTGIIASMFGCEIRAFDDTLPIGLHLTEDKLKMVLDAGVPDIKSGIVGRALDTVAYFREALKPYPKLSAVVGSELLDIQGPFDNASIIWGSDVFLAIFDEPELVMKLSDLITKAILNVLKEHRKIDGRPIEEQDGAWHHLGAVCVRNDSSVNLSGKQYDEFAKPFDRRLIEAYGGMIHFCGKAHQWWESLLDIPGLKGINPYQGEFYDLIPMYEKCEQSKISIFQWTTALNAKCRERVRTGFSRMMWVGSYEEALKAVDRLHKTGHADGD